MMHCPKCNCERDTRRGACPVCGYSRKRRILTITGIVLAALLLVSLAVWGAVAALHHWVTGWQRPATDSPKQPATVTTEPTLSRTVTVTIPEGYTVLRIAATLEEAGVCTATEFLTAVREGDYTEYTFLDGVTVTNEDGTANGRYFRLEGYLFPDTYEFYRNSSGEAAVHRFLDNFERKLTSIQTALDASGLTLDEAVTLASIIQREAKAAEAMYRVSRVLHNRLESPDYPRLQCDVTTAYLRELEKAGETPDKAGYDTYVCKGLPVGAIANPGANALAAAVSPSMEDICADCYFFVIDSADDTVYYSETYAEHLAVWAQIQERQGE
ncbi:MAG: endolytic transglycosylase MltG [Ruminococcaceae bacterium]|nr:endolytic transglycosylase MltG [Oscillospiraceae bacterium]